MRFIDNFKFDNLINLFIQDLKIYNKFKNRFKNDGSNDKRNKNNINDKIINDFKLNNRYNCVNIIKLIF